MSFVDHDDDGDDEGVMMKGIMIVEVRTMRSWRYQPTSHCAGENSEGPSLHSMWRVYHNR